MNNGNNTRGTASAEGAAEEYLLVDIGMTVNIAYEQWE